MAPRKALHEVDTNRRRGKELTAFERGRITARHEDGQTSTQIARVMEKSPNTILTSIAKEPGRTDGVSKPRTGTPRKSDARIRRRILWVVKKFPHVSYAKIRAETGFDLSNSTPCRTLREFNMEHWIAKKRPVLTEEQAEQRLKWAKERKDWTFDD